MSKQYGTDLPIVPEKKNLMKLAEYINAQRDPMRFAKLLLAFASSENELLAVPEEIRKRPL